MPDTDAAAAQSPGTARSPSSVIVVGVPGASLDPVASVLADLGGVASPTRAITSSSAGALAALGHGWDDPPPVTPYDEGSLGSELGSSNSLAPIARRARRALAAELAASNLPGGPTVQAVGWADSAATLVLPFWRSALGDASIAAVLVVDDPLSSAAAIARTCKLPPTSALALWERYQRSALEGLRGLRVLVTTTQARLADPAGWTADLSEFLTSCGIAALGSPASGNPTAGATAGAETDTPDLTKIEDLLLLSHLQLAALLKRLEGAHDCFDPPSPDPESPWVTAVLGLRSDLAQVWRGLDWAAGRLASFVPKIDEDEPDEHYPLNATADRDAYHEWLEARGEPTSLPLLGGLPEAKARVRPHAAPLFSVVVPVYRPPAWALDRCVASVLNQTFADFQLCLTDDASGDPLLDEQLRGFTRLDPRVNVVLQEHNGGISVATNASISRARGQFIVFLDNDDELHSTALERLAAAIEAHPEADVLYSDEDKLDDEGIRCTPSLKPAWSPDLLLSCAYLCHLFVVRHSLVDELGGLRSEFDGSQDFDLMLRATERAREVVHVPEILYHWRVLAGSSAGDTFAKPWAYAAGRRAIESALVRRGVAASVEIHPRFAGNFHVRRKILGDPLVSMVMPFRDEPGLTAKCVRSVMDSPGWEHFELLLVDNDSELPETAALLAELSADPRVRVLPAPGPFDWARINNEAAADARGDLLLFINNDIEARARGWLDAMVGHAQRPEVGAVGALLRYPDLTIQHAGVVVGMNWGAAHVQQDLPYDRHDYLLLSEVTRDCSAVTGACMMTRRSVFEEAGGFDRNLPVAFNDIDYCLRLREQGLLVVYTPLAELIHYESKSRGHSDDVLEVPYFYARWRDAILAGDPYHNPNLTKFDPYCRLSTEEDRDRWSIFRSMLEASSTS